MGTKATLHRLLQPLGLGVYRIGRKNEERVFLEAALRYKKSLVRERAAKANFTVLRGPFQGMKLPEMGAWSDFDLFSKIIGSYEAEIFPALEAEIAREPNLIVNIGASEGYYAIGLKRRLPGARAYTYDIDEKSFPVLDRCSSMNGVEIVRLDRFDYANPLAGLSFDGTLRPFFFLDCEGYENHIVDMPQAVVAVSSFLIELHDLFVPGTTPKLVDFLSATHTLTLIDQQQRKLADYPELGELHGLIGALVLDEFRGAPMQWLYAVPK